MVSFHLFNGYESTKFNIFSADDMARRYTENAQDFPDEYFYFGDNEGENEG